VQDANYQGTASGTLVITKTNYTITATAGANGSITPSGAVAVNSSANQTFTITPNNGYRINTLTVDGSAVTPPVASYTFSNVTANHTIAASFAIDTFTVNASVSGGHGAVAPAAQTVNYGASATINITPDTGYHIASITDNSGPVTIANPFVISNVTAGHSVVVTFAIDTYTITASAGANGSISPSGAVAVSSSANQTFTITPSTGYHIADVLVDGSSMGTVASYTFSNVTANHTIAASFVLNAVVNINPDTLNLKSQSDKNAITAYIELPSGYNVSLIDVTTIRMSVNGTIISAQLTPTSIGDNDNDGVADLMVKFDRQAVIAALSGKTGDVSMTVTGQLADGRQFAGTDTIKVINPMK